jgi:hypothetical protein
MFEFNLDLPLRRCFFHNSKFDFKDELMVLWRVIHPSLRVDLIFHIGRLVDAIDNGTVDSSDAQLRTINFV